MLRLFLENPGVAFTREQLYTAIWHGDYSEKNSTGDVITAVAQNPGAIGYASLASMKDTVKAVKVEGVAPSEETVKDGTYAVQRPFVLVTKADTQLSAVAQKFFDFVTSADANELITAAGVVPNNQYYFLIKFAAFSGTGKTTLIEKIVRHLKAQGYRIAVIKHDAHKFEIDKEGKDSWRFSKAGADITLISSTEKTAIIEQRQRSFEQNLAMIHDVDLILVEGYKQENIPKIGICRKAIGKGLPNPITQYIAVVTDDEVLRNENIPSFALDDVQGICDFIRNRTAI